MTVERRPWGEAVLWLCALGPFFFLTYGLANWLTAQRLDVHELAFAWERHIPFLPWTIVPYWTTDFFYAGSLLLCATRRELRTQGLRLLAVQVFCVAGFLLVPLQFTTPRPHPGGVSGQLFDALMTFDRPYNQAPSLHVALTAVLWADYSRHLRGWLLWLVRGWFVMMALSTLTTYQHHFIDLPTGLWAGLFAVMLFPSQRRAVARLHDLRRFRIAAWYASGAAVLGLAAWAVGGAAWLLLWLAAALAVVSGIYVSGRAEMFGKTESGAMTQAAFLALAPYVAGAWMSSRWHTWRVVNEQEVADGVWLGRIPRLAEWIAADFRSVVDVTAEIPFTREDPGFREVAYRSVPMLDLLAPTQQQLEEAAEAIEAFRGSRPTLVCCALGFSRSAAGVAAWLIESGQAQSAEEAVDRIRACRPSVVLPAAYLSALDEFAAEHAARRSGARR